MLDGEDPELGTTDQEIINGNTVIWAGGAPFVLVNDRCSGVAIRNNWILTANHCIGESQLGNPSSITIRRSTSDAPLTVAEWTERSPSFDVALIKTRDPITINGSTTGWEMTAYPGVTTELVGHDVDAYGHGPNQCDGSGWGTLRQARLRVLDGQDSGGRQVSTGAITGSPDKLSIGDPSGYQSLYPGDSGSAVVQRQDGVFRLVAIANRMGCGVPAVYVSVNGFWPWAQMAMARYGFGTAAVTGDFDGDGNLELAVGAPEDGADRAGRVHIYGWTTSGARITEATLATPGWLSPRAGDRFGGAVAAGDLDHDGRTDLVIGAPGAGDTASFVDAGRAYVFRGQSGTAPLFVQTLQQRSPELDEGGDRFGSSVAIGNFDGQGSLDIAVGAPQEYTNGPSFEHRSGAVFVYTCTTGLYCTQHWLLRQASANDTYEKQIDDFGYSLAVGDFDANGRDDLAVGAPGDTTYINNADRGVGSVYLFRFAGSGFTGSKLAEPGAAEEGDRFGYALAAGNFYPGGGDDLAVGAPGEAAWGAAFRTGYVYAFRGTSTGLSFVQNFSQAPFSTDERDDFFGSALYAGPLTFSSTDELAIGAPYEGTLVGPQAGRVYLASYNGSNLAIYDQLDQSSDATASGDEQGDLYGGGLAGGYGRRSTSTGWDNHLFVGAIGERLNSGPHAGAVHASVPSSSVLRNLDWIWAP